jgi:hypothetical protein
MARKVGRAVRAFVTLGRRRFGRVLAVSGKAHLASGGAWVLFWGHGPGERKCAVAWVVAGVGCNKLVMLLWGMRGLLRRTFAARVGTALERDSPGCGWRVVVVEARHADRARLHVVGRDTAVLGNKEGLGGLVGPGVGVRGPLRGVGRMTDGLAVSVQALESGNGGVGARLPRRLFPKASFIGQGSSARERLGREFWREAAGGLCEVRPKGRAAVRSARGGAWRAGPIWRSEGAGVRGRNGACRSSHGGPGGRIERGCRRSDLPVSLVGVASSVGCWPRSLRPGCVEGAEGGPLPTLQIDSCP